MRPFITFLLLFWLAPLSAAAETPTEVLKQEIAQAADKAIAEKRLAGAVVIVFHQGRAVSEKAYGMADTEQNRPMRLDSLFRLASVSKPMVSAAAMKLVEEKKMGLDDPVTQWLPDFLPNSGASSSPDITIHHLLTHTSGLSYRFSEGKDSLYHVLGVSDGLDQPELTTEENLHRLGEAPLKFEPGTGFLYGLSTDVLGAAIAKAQGCSLPEAMESLVLGPLGMINTGFLPSDPTRLSTPYGNAMDRLFPIVDGTELTLGEGQVSYTPSKNFSRLANPSGGAGMLGSAPDFVKFLECIRSDGQGLLKRETVLAMRADQLPAGVKGPGPGRGFGYGWSVINDPEAAKVPHNPGTLAWGGAYGHSWFIDPKAELSVVIFTNTAFEGMIGTFPKDVREAVYRYCDAVGQ